MFKFGYKAQPAFRPAAAFITWLYHLKKTKKIFVPIFSDRLFACIGELNPVGDMFFILNV